MNDVICIVLVVNVYDSLIIGIFIIREKGDIFVY